MFKNYYATYIKIINDIEQLEGYNEKMPVIFVGYQNENIAETLPLSNSSTLFREDKVDNNIMSKRAKIFYKKYLGKNINFIDINTKSEILHTEEFDNMVTYPNFGSISIINGVAVVKFSDEE